jgi:hypothetical protein
VTGTPRPAFTADECETIIHAALSAGDVKAVYYALLAMAPQDPHRAEQIRDTLKLGLALASQPTRVTVVDTATVRDISGDVLYPSGRQRIMPASYWAGTTRVERALFGRNHGVYLLPTIELVDRLTELIGDRTAIEVGAGDGVLAQALGIPATDSMQHAKPPWRDQYVPARLGPPVPYGPNVIDMDAATAVRVFQPQVVIGCYVTWKDRPGGAGNEAGVDELDVLAHCDTYVFVGHDHVHRNSALWSQPHTIEYPPYVYSRAVAEGRHFIGVWPGRNHPPTVRQEDHR